MCAESALQLTVTKSSLGIFAELLQVSIRMCVILTPSRFHFCTTHTRAPLSYLHTNSFVKAYTEKKMTVLEEIDTPETYNALFTVVNKVL